MNIDRTNVAALIPCYGEGKTIQDVARRALTQLDQVVVVDDGSKDDTEAEAWGSGAEVIRHTLNQGKGAAIKTGLRVLGSRTNVEYIIILDGDGQHLPEEISTFIEIANQTQASMLVGNRMANTSKMPFIRKMTNLIMSRAISRVCGQWIPDTQCGFRMLHRQLAPIYASIRTNKFDFETEMLVVASRRGCPIEAVPVETVYGTEKSKIHPVRDTLRFWKMMSRFKREAATHTPTPAMAGGPA